MPQRKRGSRLWLLAGVLIIGCQGATPVKLATVEYVDLPRFMGSWYVIANIPTWLERDAHNAVETYELEADGSIATTFTFRAGSFDGPLRTWRPRGFVLDTDSNAIWGMQFVWPIRADFRITYLDADYQVTAIGRERRDYAWIMARTPTLDADVYAEVANHLAAQGYDVDQLQRVPQRWRQ